MKKKIQVALLLFFSVVFIIFGCQKDTNSPATQSTSRLQMQPAFDLNISLHNVGRKIFQVQNVDDNNLDSSDVRPYGYVEFRQDPSRPKIINLNVSVNHLLSNHPYVLQRAIGPINMVQGNCTSNSWLTLGNGLDPQSVMTDSDGNGSTELWRDITAIPSGSTFDIHFQICDALSMAPVLKSDCFQYVVR